MVNEVAVLLTVKEKKAIASINKIAKKLDSMAQSGQKSFGKMDAALASFAGNLGANAAMALASFAKDGIRVVAREAVAFETAFAEINTILPKVQRNSEALKKSLISLSGEFGRSQQEQAKAFYQIISSGAATGERAVKLLTQANVLATGGLGDVKSSVDILTDIINIYGAENITAAEAADSLFTTVRLGKTTISELTATIGEVLPSAQKLGIGLDDIGAALATMTTQGLTTNQRVTQLQSIFTALFKNSGSAAAKFGKDIGDAFSLKAIREKGLKQFMIDLQIATKGNEKTLSALLGRKEALNGFFALTGRGAESLGKNLEGMTSKTGAAKDALVEIQDTLANQWDVASQKIINLATVAMSPLLGVAKDMLIVFNSIGESDASAKITNLTKATADLRDVNKELLELNTRAIMLQEEDSSNSYIQVIEKKIAAQMKLRQELRAVIEAENLANGKSKDGSDSGGGKVEAAKAEFDAIQAIREEQALVEETNKARLREADSIASEADLELIRDFELRKIEIKRDSDLRKAEQQDTADKIRQEKLKINAKAELAIEVATGKKRIETAKMITATKAQQEKAAFQTASNFLAAGAALASEGSAAAKVLAISASLLNTYVAATAALAPPPIGLGPVAGIPLAASVVTLGLANVARMKGFANGGVVGGFNGSGSYGKDDQVATVKKGEMWLNAPQQKTLFDIANGETSGGGNNNTIAAMLAQPIIIQIDNKEIARANRTAIQEGFSAA